MNNIEYRPLVVLVDIDNVILDTERAILNVYNKRYDENVKFEDINTWNFFGDRVKKDFFEILNRGWFWETVQPIQPMCNYVKELLGRPDLFKVKLVTATKPTNPALDDKLERTIDFTNIVPKNIIICNDKSLIHGDIMIDDYAESIKRSNCRNNWLIDRPWNKAGGYWNDIADSAVWLNVPFLHNLEGLYKSLAWCNHSIKQVTRMYID